MKIKNKLLLIVLLLSVFVIGSAKAVENGYLCGDNMVPCICIDPGIPGPGNNTYEVRKGFWYVNTYQWQRETGQYYEYINDAGETVVEPIYKTETAILTQEEIDGDDPVYNAMLTVMEKGNGVNNVTLTAVRMLSCLSGYSKGHCGDYISKANKCLAKDGNLATDWQTISNAIKDSDKKFNGTVEHVEGGELADAEKKKEEKKANKSKNNNTQKIEIDVNDSCSLMQAGVAKAAEDLRKDPDVATVDTKELRTVVNEEEQSAIIITKVTIRNFSTVGSKLAVSNVISPAGRADSDYAYYFVGKEENVPNDLSGFTRIEIGKDKDLLPTLMNPAGEDQYVVYIAYKIDGFESYDKLCKGQIELEYSLKDPSLHKGVMYSFSGAGSRQRFVSLGLEYETYKLQDQNFIGVDTTDPGRYTPEKTQTWKSKVSCGIGCPADGGMFDNDPTGKSAGYGQICKDDIETCNKDKTNTPCVDNENNATYMYREGYELKSDGTRELNIEKCIMNKTDMAKNTYVRNDFINRYCTVACREEYKFTMPYKRTVNEGRYFQIGMQIDGELHCYSSVPDKKLFADDLVAGQIEMIKAHNTYKMLSGGGKGYDYVTVTATDQHNASLVGSITDLDLEKADVKGKDGKYLSKDEAKTQLEKTIDRFDKYINDYAECSKWNITYNFNPEVLYEYDEPQLDNNKWVRFDDAHSFLDPIQNPSTTDEQAVYCTDANPNTKTYECTNAVTGPTTEKISYIVCKKDGSGCYAQEKDVSTITTVHKWKKGHAAYDTKRVYYVNTAGNITVDKNQTHKRASDENVVQGIPVDISTPTGTYYYRMKVRNIGMYFGNNGATGRIYPTKTDELDDKMNVVINVIKDTLKELPNGIKVSKNGYACIYGVNDSPCPGHSSEECILNDVAKEHCIKACKNDQNCIAGCVIETYDQCKRRICPYKCEKDPDIDTTDCVYDCIEKEGKTEEECVKQCEPEECIEYCVKEAENFYVCKGTVYDKDKCTPYGNTAEDRKEALAAVGCSTDDEKAETCKANYNCCPNCTVFCIDGKCTIETKCNGPECPAICIGKCSFKPEPNLLVQFREVTPANLNPNDRKPSYNWNSENPTNELVAEKARLTINNIETKAENPTTPTSSEVAQETSSDSVFVFVMTPDAQRSIRNDNKGKSGDGSKLRCEDFVITSRYNSKLSGNKEACEKAGYSWMDNKCVIQGAACYSTFIDKLINGDFGGTATSENRSSSNSNFTESTEFDKSSYGLIITNKYFTFNIYETLDIDGDGRPDVGPAMQ